MPYPKPYQIDASLPEAASVNPNIANQQQIESIIGPTNAAANMYTQNQSAFGGDPNKNAVNGSFEWNKLSNTQKLTYLASSAAAPLFAGADLSTVGPAMAANVGPAENWNLSYEQAGVVPGVAGVLEVRDGMIPGTTQRVTVLLLPKAAA